MYKKILVTALIDEGKRLLEALARKRFPVKTAIWHYFSESEIWRLVIISPAVDRHGPMVAYKRVQSILASTNPSHLILTDIAVVSPREKDYHDLHIADIRTGQFGEVPATRQIVIQNDYVYQ